MDAHSRAGLARPLHRPPAGAHHRSPRARMSFKDHFSRQSAAYRRYRPAYPPELIEFVAAQRRGAACSPWTARPAAVRPPWRWRPGSMPCWRWMPARASWPTRNRIRACPLCGEPCRTAAAARRQRRPRRGRAGRPLVRLRSLPRRVPPRPCAGRRRRDLDLRAVPRGRRRGRRDRRLLRARGRRRLAARARYVERAIARCRSRGARNRRRPSSWRATGTSSR